MRGDRRRARTAAGGLLAVTLLAAAPARAQTILLLPAAAQITLRAYGLGIMPLAGSFTRFQGRIDYDPAQPERCSVELVADAASLTFADPDVRDEVLSPAFLDAAAFPTLAYRGGCASRSLAGQLALHGQSHPFSLALTFDEAHLVATGTIDRTEWGITGRRLMVGASVRIEVSVALPAGVRGAVPGFPARAALR